MTVPDGARPVPGIAIVTSNTLEAVGLASLIHTMMPQADIQSFAHAAELAAADDGRFAHYFISAEALMEDAALFDGRHHRTFVLIHGNEPGQLPADLHTLNICQPEAQLVRGLLRLEQMGHGPHRPHADAILAATSRHQQLTPREREVLYWLALGFTNKEISKKMILSEKTIKNHVSHILKKLELTDRTKAAALAWREGLPQISEDFYSLSSAEPMLK